MHRPCAASSRASRPAAAHRTGETQLSLRRGAVLLLACALGMAASAAQAQELAGTVSTTAGTVVVQKADGSVRTLAPGAAVHAGDVISTQPNSSAVIRFTDGGELTVTTDSQVRLDAYRYKSATPQSDNLALSLLKGGMRSLTGFIGRGTNRDAYRLQTGAATIGIRGTDFAAQLCEGRACAEKGAAQPAAGAGASGPGIAARVALLSGTATAVDSRREERRLAVGGPVYQGDVVHTGEKSYAVLVFSDEGRVTLQPGARLEVERYRHDPTQPASGLSVLRLLRGGMRALTGALARAQPQAYRVETTVATIGIRGTGFDAWCGGPCAAADKAGGAPGDLAAGDGLYVNTWQGVVDVGNPAGSQDVGVGGTVQVTARERAPEPVSEAPPFMRDAPGPRPDGVQYDMRQLFGGGTPGQTDPGLYVIVNDGRIFLVRDGRTLELERGESAFASLDGDTLQRLQFPPVFLQRDPVLTTSGGSGGGVFCSF